MKNESIKILDPASDQGTEALRLLLTQNGDSIHQSRLRVRQLFDCLDLHPLSIGTLAAAVVAERVIGAAMVIDSPGAIGAVFLPLLTTYPHHERIPINLLRRLATEAWPRGLSVLQTLLPPDEYCQTSFYEKAGFELLAELAYLERLATAPYYTGPMPTGLEFVSLAQTSISVFAEVLELTYRQSRDCPRAE